jgi:hydroxymethylbilane synthase
MPNLIIGSRGSRLALWQSNWVKDRLEETYSGLVINIEIIKTTGDKLTEASLAQIGGKGVFTKEIEEALLDYRIDLAVHSLKDLPTSLPPGLHIAAITEREDVRDALIVREALRASVKSTEELPEGARVGTSSLRRASQLRNARPDLRIIELRGNVETRLRKLDEGDYDAIILASAGLNRLGFDYRVTAYLSTTEMLPAVGQGALGIEARVDDHRANLLLEVLNHQPTRYAAEAERAVLRSLGGGCAVPIAAFAHIKKNRISQKLVVDALVSDVEGRRLIRHQVGGPVQQAEELGAKLAEMLIEAGARELLPRIGSQTPLGVQTANGAADVEILAESLAQAPIAAPPEDGATNYSAESYASVATPEGGTTNYSAESYASITATPEGGGPNYYAPPEGGSPNYYAPPEGETPNYFAESLAPIAAPEEGTPNELESFAPNTAPHEVGTTNEFADMEASVDSSAQAPAATPPEGGDPGYLETPPEFGAPNELGYLVAPPEGGTPNELATPPEDWTPSYLVAPPDGGIPNEPGSVEAGLESFAQAPIAAPEGGTPNELAAAPEVGILNELAAAPEGATLDDLTPPGIEAPAARPTLAGDETANSISVSTSLLENEIQAKAAKAEIGGARLPLTGRRVIVTRAVKQSGEMTRALEAVGAEVVQCPTIEIREPSDWAQLDWALIHLSWYDWLVFTSANGVEYFLRRLDALGHGRAELISHRVCAVGSKTADKLKSENISVDLTPERFTAEAVVEEFIKRFGVRHRLRGSRMLLPASRTTRDVIRPALEKIGVYVEVVEAYQTVTPATNGVAVARVLRDAEADYIVFTSPSTVANLAAILETDQLTPQLANTRVACIGPVTAEAARLHGLTVHIQPEEHTGRAIVTAIVADSVERRPAAS